MVVGALPEIKEDEEKIIADFENFDETVKKLQDRLRELEKIDLDKLMDLREKNNKLIFIRNQIRK